MAQTERLPAPAKTIMGYVPSGHYFLRISCGWKCMNSLNVMPSRCLPIKLGTILAAFASVNTPVPAIFSTSSHNHAPSAIGFISGLRRAWLR
jgi:hypothetical protein